MLTLAEHVDRLFGAVPAAPATCPCCKNPTALFALTRDDEFRWRCGHCRLATAREAETPYVLTWADIRGQRDVFLQRTDWTQLPDVPEATRELFAPLRQAARDLTSLEDPSTAQAALAAILAQAGQ